MEFFSFTLYEVYSSAEYTSLTVPVIHVFSCECGAFK